MGQFGRIEAGAADGGDTGIFGWGAAAKGGVHLGPVTIKGTLVALSADDAREGNDSVGFLWSGKRPAQGILMNENPIRDVGDNVDELPGTFDGWFWEMRTGLAGGDIGVYCQPLSWLNVGAVSQALLVLNSDNALGSRLVGSENSLAVDLQFLDGRLNAILNGGVLLPGGVGAAYINLIDREATDVLVFSQVPLVMRF